MSKPLPGLDVPVVNMQTGQMTQAWYEYFQSHLPDVSTVPTNGQVLTYDSTLKKWKPN